MSHLICKPFACAALLLLLGPVFVARAGDSVDYSAPYVTLEDGELVTKYPANSHDEAADVIATELTDAPPPKDNTLSLILPLAAIALGLLMLLLRQRWRTVVSEKNVREQNTNRD